MMKTFHYISTNRTNQTHSHLYGSLTALSNIVKDDNFAKDNKGRRLDGR